MMVTFLIAWASLSVGIVMGATWKALCEKQSRQASLPEDSMALHRLHVEPQSWRRQAS